MVSRLKVNHITLMETILFSKFHDIGIKMEIIPEMQTFWMNQLLNEAKLGREEEEKCHRLLLSPMANR